MGKINREKFKVFNGVFDEKTINNLIYFQSNHYFDKIEGIIKEGKEAMVIKVSKFDKEKEKKEFYAIKIYRVTSVVFRNISSYINRDFRFREIKGNMRKVILKWVLKEYKNLNICFKNNLYVPKPIKIKENLILMEYLDGDLLKDTNLINPEKFFNKLIIEIKKLVKEIKLIHADLSEYNIIVKIKTDKDNKILDEIPYFIDFGQSISIKNKDALNSYIDLLEKDIQNIVNHFNKKYKLNLNFEKIKHEIINK